MAAKRGPRDARHHAAELLDVGGRDEAVDKPASHLWPRAVTAPHQDDEWPFEVQATAHSGRFEISYVNSPLMALLGATSEDGRHPQPWQLFVPEAELSHIEELVARSIAGEGWSDWLRVSTRSGEQFVLEVRAETSRVDDDTQKIHFRLRDISEMASALALLSEHESRLRLLLAELPIIVWTCNHDLAITSLRASPLVRSVYEGRDLIGATIGELFHTIDSDLPSSAERAALRGERAAYEVEWKGKCFRCSVEPKADLFGKITGTTGTALLEGTTSSDETRSSAEVELRRASNGFSEHPPVIEIGGLAVDPAKFVATKNGRELPLTVTEFRLLVEFATNPSRVLTRDELVERVWGYGFGSAMLTMAVKRLRAKLEDDPAHPTLIETVRGVGYRLRTPSSLTPQ